jgi:hypothetical protein
MTDDDRSLATWMAAALEPFEGQGVFSSLFATELCGRIGSSEVIQKWRGMEPVSRSAR